MNAEITPVEPELRSSRGLRSRMARGPRLLRSGALGLAVLTVCGLLAPAIAPYDPLEQTDVTAGRHLPPLSSRYVIRLEDRRILLAESVERRTAGLWIERRGERQWIAANKILNLAPSGVDETRFFLLGSDRLSRDVFSRLIHGARISLWIGFASLSVALLIGILVGAAAGLGPRWLDALAMRVVDGLIAFPWLVLLIVLVAVFPTGTGTLVLLLGGSSWMPLARLVRAEMMSYKEREFALAARGLGASPLDVFWHHLLPNALTPIIVAATLQVGGLIVAESTLSFLGFGVQQPHPSWGNMIAESRPTMSTAWWEGLFPGLALMLTVIALQSLGDGLRDFLDPRREPA